MPLPCSNTNRKGVKERRKAKAPSELKKNPRYTFFLIGGWGDQKPEAGMCIPSTERMLRFRPSKAQFANSWGHMCPIPFCLQHFSLQEGSVLLPTSLWNSSHPKGTTGPQQRDEMSGKASVSTCLLVSRKPRYFWSTRLR